MSEMLSEVAYFRKQQALSEEAALLGLSGFAISATHESITARMERGAERILLLVEAGRHEEAQALLNTDQWYAEDLEYSSATQTGVAIETKELEGVKEREPA